MTKTTNTTTYRGYRIVHTPAEDTPAGLFDCFDIYALGDDERLDCVSNLSFARIVIDGYQNGGS